MPRARTDCRAKTYSVIDVRTHSPPPHTSAERLHCSFNFSRPETTAVRLGDRVQRAAASPDRWMPKAEGGVPEWPTYSPEYQSHMRAALLHLGALRTDITSPIRDECISAGLEAVRI